MGSLFALRRQEFPCGSIPGRDCGKAEQSLFRRCAPYDRTKKGNPKWVPFLLLCYFDGKAHSRNKENCMLFWTMEKIFAL